MDFIYRVKIKNCDEEFKEGLGKGVIGEHRVTFDGITEDNLQEGMSMKALLDYKDKIVEEYIDVTMEHIDE